MDLRISGKKLLGLMLISSSIVFADFVSLVDVKTAGGVTILEEGSPAGAIALWGSVNPPKGWVELKGQSTNPYPLLADLYGQNLPDLRGEFVRGWDNGRGVDVGREISSFQQDELKAHSHSIGIEPDGSGGGGAIATGPHGETSTRETKKTGGTETRPRNIALMYIIKTGL